MEQIETARLILRNFAETDADDLQKPCFISRRETGKNNYLDQKEKQACSKGLWCVG